MRWHWVRRSQFLLIAVALLCAVVVLGLLDAPHDVIVPVIIAAGCFWAGDWCYQHRLEKLVQRHIESGDDKRAS